MEIKSEIRKSMKQERDSLMPEERMSKSHDIYVRLKELSFDAEYQNIMLYSAIRSEADLTEYFTYMSDLGKSIYFPKVCGDTMEFYRVKSLDELTTGAFNIAEPDITQRYEPGCGRALMIVPGLAFSDAGYRVGYGKGFYDRYLSQNRMRENIKAIGTGYDFQLLTGISFEDAYDVALDGVVTDKREVFDYDKLRKDLCRRI